MTTRITRNLCRSSLRLLSDIRYVDGAITTYRFVSAAVIFAVGMRVRTRLPLVGTGMAVAAGGQACLAAAVYTLGTGTIPQETLDALIAQWRGKLNELEASGFRAEPTPEERAKIMNEVAKIVEEARKKQEEARKKQEDRAKKATQA